MEIYKLPKPDLSRLNREKIIKIIGKAVTQNSGLFDYIQKTISPEYLFWSKVKHKPIPKGLTREEFWACVKFIRKAQSQRSPIISEKKDRFTWLKLPELDEFLHDVDLNMGGNLFHGADMDEKSKYRFISRGIMEEAIASSQLEGANTTRRVAKKLLLEGRKPVSESEIMIVNNHEAMQAVETTYKSQEINLESIFELHTILTKDILPENEQGRFRTDEDKIVVDDKVRGHIYHIAPKMSFVEKEMDKFVAFANDKSGGSFTHPIIKAIMLHFWIAYLHPFVDGNGRLARLLFYWYLLKRDYWAFSYLPISKVIKKSVTAYGQAYIYTEQDDYDLTYFIDYNIQKIKLAIKEFEGYLEKKGKENARMNKITRNTHRFNPRQIQLLQFLSQKAGETTNVKAHTTIYKVTKATAIKDIKELVRAGFITPNRMGKYINYAGTDKILDLFKSD